MNHLFLAKLLVYLVKCVIILLMTQQNIQHKIKFGLRSPKLFLNNQISFENTDKPEPQLKICR